MHLVNRGMRQEDTILILISTFHLCRSVNWNGSGFKQIHTYGIWRSMKNRFGIKKVNFRTFTIPLQL